MGREARKMRHLTVTLPKGLIVDVYDLPENFESLVQKAFAEFTELTARDYTYQDKLMFIDRAAWFLHGRKEPEERVRELIHEKLDYELDEYCSFPDESDYLSTEFMEECFEEGRQSQKLHSQYFEGVEQHKDQEQIEKMLNRFIKAVILFEQDGEKELKEEFENL